MVPVPAPPAAMGARDLSQDGLSRISDIAVHVSNVVRHRGLAPAEQVHVLLLVAANIAAAVPAAQRAEAGAYLAGLLAEKFVVALVARDVRLATMDTAGSA